MSFLFDEILKIYDEEDIYSILSYSLISEKNSKLKKDKGKKCC